MKSRFALFILLLCSYPAILGAQDAASASPAPKYTVIEGKKFFSLQNVRRFQGGVNHPGALAVMSHPRPKSMPPRLRPTPVPSFQNEDAAPGVKKPNNEVLSIFAPPPEQTAPSR